MSQNLYLAWSENGIDIEEVNDTREECLSQSESFKIYYLFSHLIIEDKFKTQHDILQYVSHRGVDKIVLIVLINFVFLVWSKIILERNDKRHRDCCSASSYDIFIYMNNHI